MISHRVDASPQFAVGGPSLYTVDTSGVDYITIHVIGASGAISFLTSNDAGDITGVTFGSPKTAKNFLACQAINLSTGTAETTAATGDSIHRVGYIGRFLQLSGGGATATKITLEFNKVG